MMHSNKITPNIWFNTSDGNLSIVTAYYKKIFEDDFQFGKINPLGETPSGKAELCEVELFRQKYSFISTANEHHPFNDAISLVIHCADQNEIDKYWDYFTQEGKASPCGWCNDKFGLRWQVIPHNLKELMSKPNAFKVMMEQQKIVISQYL